MSDASVNTTVQKANTEEKVAEAKDTAQEAFAKSKLYNWSKKLIMIIVAFLALVGVLGSSHILFFVGFKMSEFVLFLSHYLPYFGFLTGGISLGGMVKNVMKQLNLTKQLNNVTETTSGQGN